MTTLNGATKAALRDAGFTPAQWALMHGFTSGRWSGDECGCPDSRCANGFHHTGVYDCGCFETLLAEAVAWREAVIEPNRVELAAPYGLFRWADVSTPGVLVTVSATAGGFRPDSQAESVIRIEAREGWAAVQESDEHGRTVIRIKKAPATEAGKEVGGAEG